MNSSRVRTLYKSWIGIFADTRIKLTRSSVARPTIAPEHRKSTLKINDSQRISRIADAKSAIFARLPNEPIKIADKIKTWSDSTQLRRLMENSLKQTRKCQEAFEEKWIAKDKTDLGIFADTRIKLTKSSVVRPTIAPEQRKSTLKINDSQRISRIADAKSAIFARLPNEPIKIADKIKTWRDSSQLRRLMEDSLKQTRECQEAFEEKWIAKDKTDSRILTIREQMQLIQTTLYMYKKPDASDIAKMKQMAALQEEEEKLLKISAELGRDCWKLWTEQKKSLYNTEPALKQNSLYVWYIALMLGITFSGVGFFKAFADDKKTSALVRNIHEMLGQQQQKKSSSGYSWSSVGNTLYGWGATAVSPVKYLKFW